MPLRLNVIDNENYEAACAGMMLDAGRVSSLLDGLLADMRPAEHPRILHMLGIPASGKSTFLRNNPLPGAVLVSFDALMESLPEYQHDKARFGAGNAFAKWEPCARAIGYELLLGLSQITIRNGLVM